jgi:outer membrane autotransporter protein
MDMTKDGHAFSTVKTNALDHSGALLMDVKVKNGDAQQADQIQSTTASGNGVIYVNQTDAEGVHYQDQVGQPLVIADTSDAAYTVINDGNNLFETGSWKYTLVSKTLTQDDVTKYGIDPANVGKTGWILQNTADLSHKAKAALSSISTPDIWYLETDALYSQLGNYSQARSDWDVWGHYVHSKMNQDNAVSQNNYIGQTDIDTSFNGAVIGVDKRVRAGKHSSTWLGLMVGYGKGTTDFENGSSDVKSTTAGLYSIYKNDKNEYLSGILKYNHYSNSTNSTTGGGVYSDGDSSRNGYGLSILAGKRLQSGDGWFVEPQIELGMHRINSAKWNLGDMDVDTGNMNSTRARLGVGVGQTKTMANGSWDWYLRASLVHEFQGTSTAELYGEPFKVDYGGTWGQYKLGFDYTTLHSTDFNVALVLNRGGERTSPVGVQASVNIPF